MSSYMTVSRLRCALHERLFSLLTIINKTTPQNNVSKYIPKSHDSVKSTPNLDDGLKYELIIILKFLQKIDIFRKTAILSGITEM
jgi:hypothetical protein